MDYEKAYKEALKRAKDLHDNHPYGEPGNWWTCEKIFPELKESEDERIRKEITEYITSYKDCITDKEYNSWISWLEKQGEQRSWSEEDEERLQDVIYWFEILCDKNKTKPEIKESLDWLKSLKPHNWKPSEKEMDDLYYAAEALSVTLPSLKTLHEHLKAL